MGKKTKRIVKKKEANKKKLDKKFSKNLLRILPLIASLIVTINTFVFYFLPSIDGLLFIFNLFGNGSSLTISYIGVLIVLLPSLILFTKKINNTVIFVFTTYTSLSASIYFSSPSLIYRLLLSNKLSWHFILLSDLIWEGLAIYIIIHYIKEFRKKTLAPS